MEAESQSKEEPPEGPCRTHMGHADASAEGDLALRLDSVKLRQDAASVWGGQISLDFLLLHSSSL